MDGMGVERVPLPTSTLGVQRTGDHRTAARQRAFEQALGKQPARPGPGKKARPTGESEATAPGVQLGDDGLPHVDLVV